MRLILAFIGILTVFSVGSVAQIPAGGGSISGHVSVDGKGVEGLTVVARTGESFPGNRSVAKTTTDSDGNYRITGLTAGSFSVTPVAKAYVVMSHDSFNAPGKSVSVAENEAVKDIDFALFRGGVITGRITDLEGRPIIGEFVSITSEGNRPSQFSMTMFPGSRNQTDDRGIYRVYGLEPGKYKVSVGQSSSAGGMAVAGMGVGLYVKTFYPSVTEEAKATLVEVTEGSEVANIDITAGKASRGYSASGRVIDGESGQPVPNMVVGYRSVAPTTPGQNEDSAESGGMSFSSSQSDANGGFRIEGLKPGHYMGFAMAIGGNNSSAYTDPTPFEIVEGDVTGIEIKVRHGATIEGVAVVENAVDPSIAAILSSVSLYAYVVNTKGSPSFSRSTINSDGGFKLQGLSPGKVMISVIGFPTPPKGLNLVRTELNGVEQREGIEVTAGTNVTGVRLVFEYGIARIRGEVKIEGGSLPEDSSLQIALLRQGQREERTRFASADARGRFTIENVAPGVYDLTVSVFAGNVSIKPVSRTVTVGSETEVPVAITLDVSKKVEPQ